jgi:sulfite reductase (NADPH) hemoprotein beta-component
VPDILVELAAVEMHAIQSSGNSFRNVTADHYAGATADEIETPPIYAELIRQWSTLHPEFCFLPRKFKIAVTGGPNARAAVRVHDIGIQMRRNEAGEAGFEMIVGGGQERTPIVGQRICAFLPKRHLLSYLEAILRVDNQLGRRDNLFKARIKILVQETGGAAFTRLVEEEWRYIKDGALDLPAEEIARTEAYFAPPPFEQPAAAQPAFGAKRPAEANFARFARTNAPTNLAPQK